MRHSFTRRSTAAEFSGFTLVEVVMVIVLLGVLTAVVAPRLSSNESAGRDFYDNAVSGLRFAQKMAIAQHATIYVCLANSSLKVASDANCGSLLEDPAGGSLDIKPSSGSVTVSGASKVGFSFEGIPLDPSASDAPITSQLQLNFSTDNNTYTIYVEAETGYVHP